MFQGEGEDQELKVPQSKGTKMRRPSPGFLLIGAVFCFFRSEAVRDDSGSVHE